jgi:hypothetical protein
MHAFAIRISLTTSVSINIPWPEEATSRIQSDTVLRAPILCQRRLRSRRSRSRRTIIGLSTESNTVLSKHEIIRYRNCGPLQELGLSLGNPVTAPASTKAGLETVPLAHLSRLSTSVKPKPPCPPSNNMGTYPVWRSAKQHLVQQFGRRLPKTSVLNRVERQSRRGILISWSPENQNVLDYCSIVKKVDHPSFPRLAFTGGCPLRISLGWIHHPK